MRANRGEARLPRLALWIAMVLAAPAAAAPSGLVLLPPRDPGLDGTRLEEALIEAARALPGLALANARDCRLIGPRAALRVDPAPTAQALALAHELGASRAVVVEAHPLGDGLAVYLEAVTEGQPPVSTTVSLTQELAAADRQVLRGALTAVLQPNRYVGRLSLSIDVPSAVAQIDGHPMVARTVALPVGTHALRVTHPQYRDFVRFVTIEFDHTTKVVVDLTAFPRTEGEMTTRRAAVAVAPAARPPWWRSWWALTLSGVVLTGAAVGVVWLARPGIERDRGAIYTPTPTP